MAAGVPRKPDGRRLVREQSCIAADGDTPPGKLCRVDAESKDPSRVRTRRRRLGPRTLRPQALPSGICYGLSEQQAVYSETATGRLRGARRPPPRRRRVTTTFAKAVGQRGCHHQAGIADRGTIFRRVVCPALERCQDTRGVLREHGKRVGGATVQPLAGMSHRRDRGAWHAFTRRRRG